VIAGRRDVAVNVVWNWLGHGITLLVGLYVARFIVDQLGPTITGAWVLLGAIMGYYGLFNLGVDSAVVRHISKHLASNDGNELRRTLAAAQAFFLAASGFVLLISITLAAVFRYGDSVTSRLFTLPPELKQDFALLLLIMGMGSAVSMCARVHAGCIRAAERYDVVNAIHVAVCVGRAGAVVLFMRGSLLALGAIFAMFSVLGSIAHIVAAKHLLPNLNTDLAKPRLEVLKEIGGYGMFAFLTSIADQFRFHTDAIVIGHFLPMGQVTFYNFGNMLVTHFRHVIGKFAGPFFPLFSRHESRNDRTAMAQTFLIASKAAALLSAIGAGSLIGIGRPFLSWWLGDAIGEDNVLLSYKVLVILTAPFMIGLCQAVSISVLYGTSKHAYLAGLTGFEGIMNLALSVVLVRCYGILGVAAGTAIPMLFTKLLLQPRYVCRTVEVPTLTYMVRCILVPLLFATVLAAIQYATCFTLASIGIVAILAIAGTSSCLILPIAYRLMFTHEERERLWRVLSKVRSLLRQSRRDRNNF